MLFNSYEFIFIFLPIVYFVYFFLLEKRLILGAKCFLIFASLFFYSWWNVTYLPIILTSILFNYTVGNLLANNDLKKSISKRMVLIFGVTANLGLLGYFKYADFLIENVNYSLGTSAPLLDLALPLAISFFTFQQVAYLIDSYKGETKEYSFLNYTLFVTFFPQLIAGPIVHHSEMMPQFFSRWNLVRNYRNISAGLFIFSIGLFKKIIIADFFAKRANFGFDQTEFLGFFDAWATSLSYTFQLYFDFSGYTDMAIGAALLFNIRLPINFNSPYKAINIQDFWRRWHITLSRFLRDYIYIPLGGSRNGEIRTNVNLLATFVLGGIWHGAGWTFIFWGMLHGLALISHRLWRSLGFTMNNAFAWFITFNFVNVAWVFFRAESWNDAMKVLSGMIRIDTYSMFDFVSIIVTRNILNLNQTFDRVLLESSSIQSFQIKQGTILILIVCFAALIATSTLKNSNELLHKFRPSFWCYMMVVFVFLYSFISGVYWGGDVEFLYFNF